MVTERVTGMIVAAQQSAYWTSALNTAKITGVVLAIIAILTCTTYILRRFFRRNPILDHAHRVLVYLLTMAGVAVLLVAALLGALLPLVPGILFFLLALLLLRRYYRNKWIEAKIRYLQFKLLLKKKIQDKFHKNLKQPEYPLDPEKIRSFEVDHAGADTGKLRDSTRQGGRDH